MGGTLYRSTPEAVSALVGLRDRLPSMGDCVRWAREMTAALPASVGVVPPVPHTGTFFLLADGEADEVNRRLAAYAEEHRLLLTSPWSPTDQPGRVRCEIAVGDGALGLDAVEVAGLIGDLLETGSGS